MKKVTFIFIAVFCLSVSYGQSAWKKADEGRVEMLEKVNRSSFPSTYQLFQLDIETFKEQLKGAPVRGSFSGRSKQIIYLPNEEGNLERFYVMETPILEDALARKYPMIKSYAAQGADNPRAVARFSVTQFGLHNMTLAPGKSILFIDPYTEDRENYIVYTKSAIANTPQSFECLTSEEVSLPTLENTVLSENSVMAADDSKLRTYRLALSCTGEYGNIFDGTGTDAQKKANIQAQMAITMTRVNGVYENDLAVTMIFVAENDEIIYYNATTDPWTGEYNTKTAQTIDALIGFNNYDIGHNFNTSGGGNAGCIGCVCSTSTNQQGQSHKGRGFTGRPNPTGDAFDIDYVAHEMGHQFGGYHTQSSANCISGDGTTEVEPGSGSTIMGYAGICPPNVQNNSDAYFHYVTIRDITNNVKTGVSSNCAQITTFGNVAPIADAGKDYVIPVSTPFVLTGSATDADGDILTYTWEQNNPETQASTSTPNQFNTTGPLFRSIEGTINPSRFFPKKTTILAGQTSNTWEVLPGTSRTMNFALTVRDNVAGGGQTATDLMVVTVSEDAGPFSITSQNSSVSYVAGSNQTVAWNVASTNVAPVNTPFVDIYMSSDNGNTFPILLASKVPNDGSEIITIPNLPGTTNRIMVRGNDNIFFDINNANFTITAATSSFAIAFSGIEGEQNKSVCKGSTISYTLPFTTFGSFNNTTNFTATNLPAGMTASFAPASATSTSEVVLTLSTTNTVISQLYTINVQATSGGTTKNVNVYANVLNNTFSSVTLTTPANTAQVSPDQIDFSWTASTGATNYDIEIATDANFTTIVETANVVTTAYSSTTLGNLETYFWRVLPRNEGCSGTVSSSATFSTIYCGFTESVNVPVVIPVQASTVTSTLIVDELDSVTLSDVNVRLNISHSWVSDLTVKLTSPNGTIVQLFTNKCSEKSGVNATFDDEGIAIVCGNNPAISGVVMPSQVLSAFNGETSEGTWILTVTDGVNQDGGQINEWGISFCSTQAPLEIAQNELTDLMVYPNPNNGSFNVQFKNASDEVKLNVYDMAGRTIFQKSYTTQGEFNENIQLNAVQSGVYLMAIFDGQQTQVRRIIVN